MDTRRRNLQSLQTERYFELVREYYTVLETERIEFLKKEQKALIAELQGNYTARSDKVSKDAAAIADKAAKEKAASIPTPE